MSASIDDVGGVGVGRRGRRPLRSFGGKTGVWWRADDNYDNSVDGAHSHVKDNHEGGDSAAPSAPTTATSTEVFEVGQAKEENDGEDTSDDDNYDDIDTPNRKSRHNRKSNSCWDDLQMGWDDELCRPIYYSGFQNPSSSTSRKSEEEEQDDDDDKDDDDCLSISTPNDDEIEEESEHGEEESLPPAVPSSLSSSRIFSTRINDEDVDDAQLSVAEMAILTTTAKKRRRNQQTFGRQSNKRRAVSLVILDHLDDDDEVRSTTTTTTSSSLSSSIPAQSPTQRRPEKNQQSATFLEEEILQSQQENIHARRISTSPPKSKSSNDHTLDGPEVYESVFDFIKQQSISAEETLATNHHHRSNKGKKDIVKLNRSVATKKNVSDAPNPRSSLDDARIYFAELDQTQPLKLDCSQSPVLSSKITRTIRGVDLTSPGLQTDYETYVEVTVGSGVSPLPIEQFVSSRRMNMRKRGDLFDGFLDVDVGGDN